ncbi:UDP-3-O-(3-hydroxymyristoyl)glucosamine N-acyltransferase [Spirulina sp. CS-785/01]|uniref:UDP-3-O-(3-hydroxymyristoyl)glucosamine N-acyltransferase n=1 Tax=Spirulina sp. CS-785/01 TaxID=3021716 RepID=UPI002330BEBA|nr:UDP-3-O-(3-hydroxymyristoyl)glucosamine N-acyltransferase [Spirulina sp. CS-785/01]MDB9313880.1 UDP-3-O-(3-hydroxymyristoyl)glucosamine N-acyltransferase [Spirulina sp. CS-785/01]
MKFSEILQQLKPEWVQTSSLATHPDCNPEIEGLAAVEAAIAGQLSYIEGETFAKVVQTPQEMLQQTQGSALILPLDEGLQQEASHRGIAWIGSTEPRLLFARVTQLFYQPYRPAPQVHPTAVIDETVQLGKAVSIGANVVIQRNAVIGDGVCLFPNVTIYPEVEVGDNTVIHANCTIEEHTIIGKNCIIHAGAAIGSEGFGFVPSPTEGWVKMEQMGRVVLEDQVDIGSNTTIDRPALGETRIGYNTKIDNLVQIAHGCTVGQNCAISSQVGLSGKVTVGNQVLLAGQVGVANRVTIGEGAIATAKSGLHKDVPPKAIVSGYPAIPNKLWLKISAVYNRLPEMYKLFRKLSRS